MEGMPKAKSTMNKSQSEKLLPVSRIKKRALIKKQEYDINGVPISEAPPEPIYGPDNPPPVKPPPAGPTRRPCRKCGHKYNLSFMKPFLIPISSEIYKQMLVVYKDGKWLKTMLKQ